MSLKSVLKHNLADRMLKDPDVRSPAKLAKRCWYARGPRKGRAVGARTIGYIFEDKDDKPGPSIDLVEAIALALKIEPWELLVDKQTERQRIIGKLFGETYEKSPTTPPTPAPLRVSDHRLRTQDLSRFVRRRVNK